MGYEWATWLAPTLRKAGLNVVEEAGWKTRGLSTAQRFEPRHLVWHHDASSVGPSPGVPRYMIDNWSVAGAQIWVCRGCNGAHVSGTWHLVGAGRAAHAGKVLSGMPDNFNSLGIETDHTTGEKWDSELLASLRFGSAVILDRWKQSARVGLHFHKSVCDPVGRKVDPDGLDLALERARVAIEVANLGLPKVSLKRVQKAAGKAPWSKKFSAVALVRDRRLVKRALKAEKVKSYREFTAKVGLSPHAVPRKGSLVLLGERNGFRVTA